MNTEPTDDLIEQLRAEVDDETTRRLVDEELPDVADQAGPTIDIVVDGRTLDDAEVAALLQKPVEELTDAEREGLQPIFDQVQAEQQQGIDPLALASDLLREAFLSLQAKPPAWQRLEHKIALGHALAALVDAQSTRNLMLLTQQQTQMVMQAQQAQIAKAAGPAAILIPQVHLGNGRG